MTETKTCGNCGWFNHGCCIQLPMWAEEPEMSIEVFKTTNATDCKCWKEGTDADN